jgi:outer membrane lipoprotein-sorting protein
VMRRLVLLLAGLPLLSGWLYGQTTFKPLPANEMKSYLEKIKEASASFQTISCKFSQTKTSSLLKDPSISQGNLYIRDRKKLRWECVSPYPYTFILNNGKGTVLKSNRTADMGSRSKRFPKEISEFLLGGFTPELLLDKKRFTTTMFISNKLLKIKLVPVQKRMKSALSQIVICFDLKDYSISSIELREETGDITEIVLFEKKFNAAVSDVLFQVKN